MTPNVPHALLAQAVEVHFSVACGPITRAYPTQGIWNNNLVFAGHLTVLGASELYTSLLKFVFDSKLPGSVPERQSQRAKAVRA
jgi:hypothetical protein